MHNNSNRLQKNNHYWSSDIILLWVSLMLFYLLWLGSHALLTPDEARYSEIAREMVLSKDYITPHLNGTVFLDKPVLYYWLQASAIKLLGVNEWALRLWPALIGIMGCLFTYIGGRLLFNRRTGILAAIILATCPLYYGMAHYANLDLEVAVFVSCSLLAFIVAMQQQNTKRFIGLFVAYGCAGLAILTKGLIGIAFPMLIIGSWILLLNNWHVLKKMHLISGLLLILIITGPWYVLVQQANPDFVQHFFLNQQFSRFLSKDFNDVEPFWFYFPVVLAGVLPWLIFLPKTFFYHYQLIKQDKSKYNVALFLLLWPLLIFIFFSIPQSKTIGYIIPVMSPLALLIANYLDSHWNKFLVGKLQINRKMFSVFVLIIVILEIVAAASISYLNLSSVKPLANTINQLAKPADEIVAYYKYYQDLPLYTQRRITVVANWDSPAIFQGDSWRREISNYFQSPAAHQWLITDTVFWRHWHSNQRVFALVNKPELEQFKVKATPNYYKLNTYRDINLYTNKPLR